MTRFIGLDVHKRVIEACMINELGNVLLRARFGATAEEIQEFARRNISGGDRVALEATTNTWPIVRLLRPFAQVVVSNPLKTKAIAEAKVKTDKVDAYVLAQLLRCDFLPSVWQPDEATSEMRRLTHRRAALVFDRTAIKNRIHSVLHQRLIHTPVPHLFGTQGRQWLKELKLDDEGRQMIDADLRILERVETEITALDNILAPKAYADERVKLLMTLPGVDVVVAQTLLAALGDVKRFKDGDHAASYLGLVPSTKQSAETCHHGPITKAGNQHARWSLVQAAQHLAQHKGPLGVFFHRVLRRKNRNVAVVATARKLVVIAWQMLIKNEPYRYAQPRLTETKLSRLRVRVTGAHRKTGPRKGTKRSVPKFPGGSRTIKPLAQVYAEEGLPKLNEPRPGEKKFAGRPEVAAYIRSLSQPRFIPRRPGGSEDPSPAPQAAPAISDSSDQHGSNLVTPLEPSNHSERNAAPSNSVRSRACDVWSAGPDEDSRPWSAGQAEGSRPAANSPTLKETLSGG